MKKYIISFVLVMVVFISVSVQASGLDLTEYEKECNIGLTIEEKLRMKAAWNIIELIEDNASIWYSGVYVIVEFDFGVYDRCPTTRKRLSEVAKAFQLTDNRVIKVIYLDSYGNFIGYANKNATVFLLMELPTAGA